MIFKDTQPGYDIHSSPWFVDGPNRQKMVYRTKKMGDWVDFPWLLLLVIMSHNQLVRSDGDLSRLYIYIYIYKYVCVCVKMDYIISPKWLLREADEPTFVDFCGPSFGARRRMVFHHKRSSTCCANLRVRDSQIGPFCVPSGNLT